MARPSSLIRLLEELVAIPSVNPAGDPGTPHVNEQALAVHLEKWTRKAGAASELMPVLPDRPNLLATWKPLRPVKTRLCFAPHTDTVSVAGMTVAPFSPTIRRGRLYGRGASDTKGPMAAMLWAIAEWWRTGGRESSVEVTFAGLMGEEAGNDGAHALAARRPKLKADLVIVGEPTDLKIVTAHKGALWFEIHTTGRACHASAPDRGTNAIYEMSTAIDLLRRDVLPRLARRPHPLLGGATLSVGMIRGGSKVNIVPDACSVEIDARTTPAFSGAQVLAEVRRALPRTCRIVPQRTSPGLATDPRLPLIGRLKPFSQGLTGVPWFCDAAIFAAQGLPSIAFGPGSIAQAHTKDEFIRIADLEAGAQAYLGFLRCLT